MSPKLLVALLAGSVAISALPASVEAGGKKVRRDDDRIAHRDCKPVNGPYGYYGNPWCDGGYKYSEDYAPGTGGYFDVFDLPRFQRFDRWLD
jgi:hypothetical protein